MPAGSAASARRPDGVLRGGLAAGGYALSWLRSPARRGRSALPVQLNLPITDNCNARCVMCDVWKERSLGELGPDDLRGALRDGYFAAVQHVGISGGEPSLRGDLVEIARAVLESLPRLRSLSVTTHGFHTRRWARSLPSLAEACAARGVALRLHVSIDGVGALHERVRRVPGAWSKALATSRLARDLGIEVQWQTTVSAPNVYGVAEVLAAARGEGVEVIFRRATEVARLDNAGSLPAVALDPDESSFFADFLDSDALHEATRSPARRLFYRDLAERLRSGGPRRAPCFYQREGVLLTAHGELFPCSIARQGFGNALRASALALATSPSAEATRERLVAEVCPGCLHDQSGAWSPLALAGEVAGRTRAGRRLRRVTAAAHLAARALGPSLRALRVPAARAVDGEARAASALLVGAYGGEHVGDAAILAGVLGRLAARRGLERAVVASTRPDRTRRWLRAVDAPVPVEVIPHQRAAVRRALGEVQALVFAGGPLMDLPDLLVRHLDAALEARRRGLPFWIEGVGVGPFRLAPSRWIARRLALLADRVSVRSAAAAAHPVVAGAALERVRDPAFDYLESRREPLRVLERERASLAELFGGTGERLRVGLNLRPLWHKYGGGAGGAARVQEAFLDRLADALRRLGEALPLSVLFFPMNADQYGFSDLAIAHELASRVGDKLDFRVWRMEPGVDALLLLLRQLHAVVAMRFHAGVFALSQGLPTLGIDYAVGGRGKVAELFDEAGLAARVCPIERFRAEWLVERLAEVAGAPPGAAAVSP